jgi:hypothetical protein
MAEGGAAVRRLPLGKLLVQEGVASEADVQDALDECIRRQEGLAEVGLRRGWISEKKLAKLLADQDPGGARVEKPASPVDLVGAWVQQTTSPVDLVGAWLQPTNDRSPAVEEKHDSDGRYNAAAADDVNFEEEPMGTIGELDEQMLRDTHVLTVPESSGSVVGHLNALVVEVELLEQELLESRRLVDAQEAEMAELREARASDLNTISGLGAELEERRGRLDALRAAVGELAGELDG